MTQPLRIGVNGLFLSPDGGGIWTYFSNLMRELPQVDPEIAYVLFANYRIAGKIDPTRTGVRNVSERRVTESGSLQAARLASAFLRLPLETRSAHLALLWSPTPFAPIRWGSASVVTLHDMRHEDLKDSTIASERVLLPALARHAARSATHILTVSEDAKRRIERVYGVSSERITVAHLASSPHYFARVSSTEIARVRARYGIHTPYILSAATSHPHKNAAVLLDAFAALQGMGETDTTLVLFGSWEITGASLQDAIRTTGMDKRVILTGYVPDDDLPALYQGAEVFVLPSRYEGFGLPVLEAMASGTPVITTTATSLPEVAGDAALLFNPDDREALVASLRHILENATLRAELIARGKARARHFTWRKSAEITLAAFRQAITPQAM